MLKKIVLTSIILLPFFCSAQKFYLQTGAGYQFASSSANEGYAIELSTGLQLNSHFRLGLGASYLEQNDNVNPAFVPVYADIKLMGNGRIKPYVFFQPGYCIYKSKTVYYIDYNGNDLGSGYYRGGFYSYQGIGVMYKYAFL